MLRSGVEPTWSTFACVLSACAHAVEFNLGVQVHGHVVKLGCFFHEFISVSLITFYANCMKIEHAHKIFNETLIKNVVKWTALLTGYVWNNKHQDALRVFGDMTKMGVLPNQSTFSITLNACCGLEALDKGKEIHTMAIKLGLETDVFVGNSLVVMYTECGNVNSAVAVFRNINEKDIVSRSGMLLKGRCFFEYISRYKSNVLRVQHYACMVDILGRCGKLDEAEELVRYMPVKANSMIWLALLSACRVHSNLEVAERAAKHILDLEPNCSSAYVLLSNIYASAGRWADVSRMRVKMKQGGLVKQPGSSWVVLRGKKHEFLSADRSHPLSERIYEKLDWLGKKLKEFGHVPDKKFALHDVEDEQKEEMLSFHKTTKESSQLDVSIISGYCSDNNLFDPVKGSETEALMETEQVVPDRHKAVLHLSWLTSLSTRGVGVARWRKLRKMEKKGGNWGLKLKLEYAIVLCFRNVAAATTALFFLGNARAKLK
ncbi:hypothetical protein D5086_003115 [Populus alba]|uniref:Uncharacterized protein n=1 Tax=Populus alba TaxID=43335 RepID=A0ACC4D3Q0_POPAL